MQAQEAEFAVPMALAAVPTMWQAMAKPGVERSPARRPAAALCPTCRQRGGSQPSLVRQGLGTMAPKLERAGPERPERRHRQTASATRRAKYDRRNSRRAKKGNGLALLSDRYPAPKNPIDLTAVALRRRQCEAFGSLCELCVQGPSKIVVGAGRRYRRRFVKSLGLCGKLSGQGSCKLVIAAGRRSRRRHFILQSSLHATPLLTVL